MMPKMSDWPRAVAPRAPEVPAALTAVAPDDLGYDIDLFEVEIAGATMADASARRLELRASRLRALDLSGSRLSDLSVLDGVITGCNLANVQVCAGSLVRVELSGCRLTGVAFSDTYFRDVMFTGCRIDLASFGGCRLQQVTFEDCVMSGTDFLEAELHSVRFHDCDLSEADFRGAKPRRCELRRSPLTGAHGIERLAGCAMPWTDIVEQAGVWAAALGIEVLDDQ